jgi:response regulator RpfG family c-di-GMP phosphodiesterase
METTSQQSGVWNEKPMDAIQLEKILKNMGVEEYDPMIVEQFLEIIHRYFLLFFLTSHRIYL